jgi:hypothetical protein
MVETQVMFSIFSTSSERLGAGTRYKWIPAPLHNHLRCRRCKNASDTTYNGTNLNTQRRKCSDYRSTHQRTGNGILNCGQAFFFSYEPANILEHDVLLLIFIVATMCFCLAPLL